MSNCNLSHWPDVAEAFDKASRSVTAILKHKSEAEFADGVRAGFLRGLEHALWLLRRDAYPWNQRAIEILEDETLRMRNERLVSP